MAAPEGYERMFWFVDGQRLTLGELWRLAHKKGYDPQPFCKFRIYHAAEHLRRLGHTVVEPTVSKELKELRESQPYLP
jgi:hypothetical protein